MEASWLLPMRPKKPTPYEYVRNVATERKYDFDSKLFTQIDKEKLIRTIEKARIMLQADIDRKIANRPKIIDKYSSPSTTAVPKCFTCEATLMNGLKCSSKAKFGKYCGRHKF